MPTNNSAPDTIVTGTNGNEISANYYADRIVKVDGTTLIFAFKDKTFAAPTGTKTVDASNVSKSFALTGNDYYNVLIDGKGNDSLTGVKGKDTLTGGNGSDVFVCEKGDGKDFIFGFGNDDLLEIVGLGQKVTGTFNKSGDELTVKAGSTTVAVFKDFSATTFNVNKNATNHRSKNFFRRLEG